MATKVENVARDGVDIISGALSEVGYRRVPDPLFLNYDSGRSTYMGVAGVQIAGNVQNTSSHGKAWVLVASACVFSPQIDKRLVDIGLRSSFLTVSTGIKGLPDRRLDQFYQRHTKTVDGVRNISSEMVDILDGGFEWWCSHFESFAGCMEYLTGPSRNTPSDALVAVALALEEGDGDQAALIAEQSLARARGVSDARTFELRVAQFKALLS